MRTFVMGDIHGAFKAVKQCLQRAGFDREQDQLIQLGDIVDGYPEAFECVELLLSVKNRILIKGNHDDWFQSFIETDYHPVHWRYGGRGTLHSYLNHSGKKGKIINTGSGYKSALTQKDIPMLHQKLFLEQKLYYIDPANRCFIHAGFDRHLPFALQKPEIFYWDRELFLAALQLDGFYGDGRMPADFYSDATFSEVYIGHTPTLGWGSDQPIKALNITNMDTGAGHSGRLTLMELGPEPLKSNTYWQSDPVSDLYAKNYR